MATNLHGLLKLAKFTVKPRVGDNNLLQVNGDRIKTEEESSALGKRS